MTINDLTIKNTIFTKDGSEQEKFLAILRPRLTELKQMFNCEAYCLFLWNHKTHMYNCLDSDPTPFCCKDVKQNILIEDVSDVKDYEKIDNSVINEDFANYINKHNFLGFYYIPIISEQKTKKGKAKIGEIFLLYSEKKCDLNLAEVQIRIENIILMLKNYFSNIRVYRKTQQIKHLMELAKKIATSTKPEDILYKIIAKEGLGRFNILYSYNAGIILRNREGNNLKAIYKYPDNPAIRKYLPVNEPPFKTIFESKRPLTINHRNDKDGILDNFIKKYKAIDSDYAEWVENNVKSLIHIPLFIGDDIEGVLCIHQDFENAFGEAEARYFDDLATLSSLALKHLKAYQNAEEKVQHKIAQLESIQKLIIEIIKKDKKEELLQTILEAGLELVNAKSGNIRLLDREKNILYRVAKSLDMTLDGDVNSMNVGDGICGKVASDGISRIIPDSFKDADWINLQIKKWGIDPTQDPDGSKLSEIRNIERKGWMQSEISVPLKVDNHILGVMDAHHEDPEYFDNDDLKFFEDLAAISTLVLRKAKLAEQVTTIQTITEYYQKACDSVLKDFLDAVLDKTLAVLDVKKGTIAITEIESGEPKLRFISIKGIKKLSQDSYRRLNEGLIGKIALEHKTKTFNKLKNVYGHIVIDKDINSELIAPMVFDNKLQGIVMVASSIEDKFSPDDEIIISTIANATAVHIHNIKLLEEREENSRKIITETIRNMIYQTSMLAHQVKNPLMAIQISALNLNQITRSEEGDIKKQSEIILKHIFEASNTIQNMLAFAKKTSSITTGNIHSVLDETLNFVKIFQKKRNITIDRKYDSSIKNFQFDKFQIQQSLVNIILNAFEAMESKGDNLIVETSIKSKNILISITDNGIGMSEVVQKNIFEPLYSTKKGKESTGLGLSLCKEFIKANNGRISVQSVKDEGTTFNIVLPYKVKETQDVRY